MNKPKGRVTKNMSPLTTIRASAQRIVTRNVADRGFKVGEGWQDEAWDLFDLVGELHFLTTTVAERVGGAVLYVGTLSEDGDTGEPIPVESGDPADVLEYLTPTAVQRTQLLTRAAINLAIAGEGWFAGVPTALTDPVEEDDAPLLDPRRALDPFAPPEDTGPALNDLNWFFLSNNEVSSDQSGKVTLTLPSGQVEAAADDLYLIRLHRPHPRQYQDADSPTKSSLPVLRELVGLTQHISAQIDSRLAGAGLLAVSRSLLDAMKSEDPDSSGEDEFLEALLDAMMTPISDRSNASALVPMLVGVPDSTERSVADHFHHQTFSTDLDAEARNLRDEAIRRLSLGLDAPPELLLGMGSMNHWGAWLVKEETITSHVEPPLALICDALTREFLWPVLLEAGMSQEEVEKHVIWYSVRHMIARPNRTSEAITLHGSEVISSEALRREAGFSDDDAPGGADAVEAEQSADGPRERAITMVLTMIQQAPSLATDPGIPALVDQIEAVLSGDTPEETAPVEADEPIVDEDDDEEDIPGGDGGVPDTSDDDVEDPDMGNGDAPAFGPFGSAYYDPRRVHPTTGARL